MGLGGISRETLFVLIDSYPIDYFLVDIRSGVDGETLADAIESSVHIPSESIESSFALLNEEFEQRYHIPKPPKEFNVIVYSQRDEDESDAEKVALILVGLGYERMLILNGGVEKYNLLDKTCISFGWITTEELKIQLNNEDCMLVDVRRPDEISNFGKHPKAVHLPTEEFPMAMTRTPSEWQSIYPFPKIGTIADCTTIVCCRSNRRAKWAYLVARDMGVDAKHLLVFKDGVMGLSKIHPGIIPYESYDLGDPVPPPLSSNPK